MKLLSALGALCVLFGSSAFAQMAKRSLADAAVDQAERQQAPPGEYTTRTSR